MSAFGYGGSNAQSVTVIWKQVFAAFEESKEGTNTALEIRSDGLVDAIYNADKATLSKSKNEYNAVLSELTISGSKKGFHLAEWRAWREAMRTRYGTNVPFDENTFDKFIYNQEMKDPWVRAKRNGLMPWNPDAMTISIPVSATYGAGYAGSLDLTIANDGIGLGFTGGASFGTPNLSVGVGMSLTEATNGSGASIDDFIGGDGSSYSVGLGPFGVQYSQSYNKYGEVSSRSYGVSIEASSRDFGIIGSASISPMSRQVPIFKWKFKN